MASRRANQGNTSNSGMVSESQNDKEGAQRFSTKRAFRHVLMAIKSQSGGKRPSNRLDVEMQKFAARGIDLEMVDSKERKLEIMEQIRAIACPMSVKLALRKKLYSGNVKGMPEWDGWRDNMARSQGKFKRHCRELSYSFEVWGSSFRSIAGHQGMGVLSYFVLLRWMFGLNILLTLLLLGFIMVPSLLMHDIDYSGSSSITAVNISYYCSTQYTTSIPTGVLQYVIDFVQGTGFLERTELFYGHYAGTQFLRGSGSSSAFAYNIPLAYYLVPLVCLLVSLVLMARYTSMELKASILSEHGTEFEYTNTVFTSWDYSLSVRRTARLQHYIIYNDLQCGLTEERSQKDRAERMKNGNKRCCLYTTRILVNLFVLACLATSGYLIYFVITWSSTYLALNDSKRYTVGSKATYIFLLVQYMPSLTITALNMIIPAIFSVIVRAEDYRDTQVVKITLIRTVFLRLASVAMLVVTMYIQITCSPKDGCLTNQAPCTVIQCWETYVGQQMYKLVLLNFIVTIVRIIFIELPRKWATKKCHLFHVILSAEFDIPSNVLDLVYTQTLCWLGFFFAPLIPAMVVFHLFLLFYCKLLTALFACEPDKRTYRAARTSSCFFMVVLLLAFFLCCAPVMYSIARLKPSKSCGPFRIYSSMYSVMDETVATWPKIMGTIYNLLTSVVVIIIFVILLALLTYHCCQMKNAHREMTAVLQHQIKLDGRDKNVLLARIKALTCETKVLSRIPGRSKDTGEVVDECRDGPSAKNIDGIKRKTPKTPPSGGRQSPAIRHVAPNKPFSKEYRGLFYGDDHVGTWM